MSYPKFADSNHNKHNRNMKTETTPQQNEVLEKATSLARKAFAFATAEQEALKDFELYCLKHELESKQIRKILISVGYAKNTANTYASRIKIVRQDSDAAEDVVSGKATFEQGYEKARTARAQTSSRSAEAMRTQYRKEVVRAIRTAKELGKTKEEHLEYVTQLWEIRG
jgi:hypothetical protein